MTDFHDLVAEGIALGMKNGSSWKMARIASSKGCSVTELQQYTDDELLDERCYSVGKKTIEHFRKAVGQKTATQLMADRREAAMAELVDTIKAAKGDPVATAHAAIEYLRKPGRILLNAA